jgi:tetrapyrrole methylase family protein / MazG family protein
LSKWHAGRKVKRLLRERIVRSQDIMAPSKKKPTVRKKRQSSAGKRSPKTERLSAGQWFEKLVALQKRLRAPNGCPWDREQTHKSLRTYLIEEAYEVLDALESGDDTKFAEEMGDLLLQVVFHSQIAAEEGRFTVADVIREIHEKMVRRHPHVFGTKRAKDAEEVLKNWEQIKAAERRAAGAPASVREEDSKPESQIDGVPRHLPAALEGYQLTKKAARIGFDWENAAGIFEKFNEESAEIQHALDAKDPGKVEEEIGDLFFAAVNLARFLKIDPEIALKKANQKFSRRFREMERLATESGRGLAKIPREEMESLWDAAKRSERTAAQEAKQHQ